MLAGLLFIALVTSRSRRRCCPAFTLQFTFVGGVTVRVSCGDGRRRTDGEPSVFGSPT